MRSRGTRAALRGVVKGILRIREGVVKVVVRGACADQARATGAAEEGGLLLARLLRPFQRPRPELDCVDDVGGGGGGDEVRCCA
jgi:hypothetical protein